MALPYPDCTTFYTQASAPCSFPDKFDPVLRPINGVLNMGLLDT